MTTRKFKFYEFLDLLYHKSGNFLPLRWACDRYDEMLVGDDPYALRCPICEGLDYPGLSHNTWSPYCNG